MANREIEVEREMDSQEGGVRFVCDGKIDGVNLSISIPMSTSGCMDGEHVSDVGIVINTDTKISFKDLLTDLGESLHAWYGGVLPLGTKTFRSYTRSSKLPDSIQNRLFNLPKICNRSARKNARIPAILQWINYYSKASCDTIQLHRINQRHDKFEIIDELKSGAWLFQLTKEPLDTTFEEHLDVLEEAYELLPSIGKRD